MTLKENSNGNYFAAWLQEYKQRLQQVQLRGSLDSADQCSAPASHTEYDQSADDNSEAAPALAGETYSLIQQPGAVALTAN